MQSLKGRLKMTVSVSKMTKKKKYVGCNPYPNTCLPVLFPFFSYIPLIFIFDINLATLGRNSKVTT